MILSDLLKEVSETVTQLPQDEAELFKYYQELDPLMPFGMCRQLVTYTGIFAKELQHYLNKYGPENVGEFLSKGERNFSVFMQGLMNRYNYYGPGKRHPQKF